MMPNFITFIVIIAAFTLWVISIRLTLLFLNDNISSAMNQMGVQLLIQFDALNELLDLAKTYASQEMKAQIETIKSKRRLITAKSTTDDVIQQERAISEALSIISFVSEQYPQLKTHRNYQKFMGAADNLGNMLPINRRIYNDSVTQLNRKIQRFPVSLIAAILGFHHRDYLKEEQVI